MIAPSLIPKKSGQRVKTDRRDAIKLAQNLRAGELAAVFFPDEKTEAIRDLERAREDAKKTERVARHQLSKFLLRTGRRYPGKTTWNYAHRAWIAKEAFAEPAQRYVLSDGLAAVEAATQCCVIELTIRRDRKERAKGTGRVGSTVRGNPRPTLRPAAWRRPTPGVREQAAPVGSTSCR